ncbi:hypothetical protein AOA79_0204245 [Helicobacter pylori]|uniref:hypothetical protein n=1 Tax=Helicobacter pylori TaxID=210 RepID=UPI0007085151|nr:hypothetical protein [Helicobacter pylori]OKB14702.1 hypothetical protein AOD78_0207390 [Helicobacter pylori]OKB18437.1 hypothetical protein AOA79_0204245 [Helicobacter pylori]OKB19396.1 hypothetical protein AOD75_0207180 [Helicobacter pylori]
MLFKTYQKLLGASCLALYLVGCGSGGGAESPVEIEKNDFNSTLKIISKVDSVTIQGVKLNRGNCVVNFVLVRETVQGALSQMVALSQITPISMQDLKDMASVYKTLNNKERVANIENKISQLEQKGVMMEPQTLKFGESLKGISEGCDIIEAEIQTDKGAWTFNFDR